MGCGSSTAADATPPPATLHVQAARGPTKRAGGEITNNHVPAAAAANMHVALPKQGYDSGEHADKSSLSPVVVTDQSTGRQHQMHGRDGNPAISTQVLFPTVPATTGAAPRAPAARAAATRRGRAGSDADREASYHSRSSSYLDTHSKLPVGGSVLPGVALPYTPPLSRDVSSVDATSPAGAVAGARARPLKVHGSRGQSNGPAIPITPSSSPPLPSNNSGVLVPRIADGSREAQTSPMRSLRASIDSTNSMAGDPAGTGGGGVRASARSSEHTLTMSPHAQAAMGLTSSSALAGASSQQLFGDERSQVLRAQHEEIINRRHGHHVNTTGSVTTDGGAHRYDSFNPISPVATIAATKFVAYGASGTPRDQRLQHGAAAGTHVTAFSHPDSDDILGAGMKSSTPALGGAGDGLHGDPVSLTMHTRTMQERGMRDLDEVGRLSPSLSGSLMMSPHRRGADRTVEQTILGRGSTIGSTLEGGGGLGDRDRDLSHTYTYHALISHTRAGIEAEEERERAEQRERAEEERERRLRVLAAAAQKARPVTEGSPSEPSHTRALGIGVPALGDADALYDRSQVKNLSAYGYAYHATRLAAHRAGGGQHSVLHSYAYAAAGDGAGGPLDGDALYSRIMSRADSPDNPLDDEISMMAGGEASRAGGFIPGLTGMNRGGGLDFEFSHMGSRMQPSPLPPVSPATHSRAHDSSNAAPSSVVEVTPPRFSGDVLLASPVAHRAAPPPSSSPTNLQVPSRRASLR